MTGLFRYSKRTHAFLGSQFNLTTDILNIMFYLRFSISLISYFFVELSKISYSFCSFTIQWNTIIKFVYNKSPFNLISFTQKIDKNIYFFRCKVVTNIYSP